MSRKTRPEKRSSAKKPIRPQRNGLVAQRFDIRTKMIAGVLLASLIAGVTYASWLPSKSNEPATDTAGFSRNDAESPVKTVSTLSQDELAAIPPEAFRPERPEPRSYNVSQGGLPPGALPPGVALPGLTDGGRTTAQGYGLNDGVRHQFTGKERDTESGLDYFGSRYYSSAQGRFTSPDELQSTSPQFALLGKGHPIRQALPNADLTDPQSLNKYHYALNNPLRYVDPDGQKPQDSAEIKMQQAIRDLNSGRITEQQYWDRLRGGSVGVGAGVAAILAARAGAVAWTTLALWAARNPQAAQQIAQELAQTSSGSPAPSNLGAPLTSIFSVERNALTSGNLLFGSLKNAEVAAQFSRNGDTLVAGIVGVFNKSEGLTGSSIKSLINSVKDFARQEGLQKVELQAVAVINKDLEKRLLQQGFQRTTVIVNGERVDALTKTISVR